MARHRFPSAALAAGVILAATIAVAIMPATAAESVMVQCGQQYQSAKAAGTLNGADWNQYRTECAARLKAQPASVAAAPAAPAPVPAASPASASPPAPAGGGREAMHERQKQCGAEWRANKVSLVAQTPGLTWPHYWSLCNTRLKASIR